MCTNGKYTKRSRPSGQHVGLERDAVAKAPVMSAGVMMANIIW